MPFLDQGLVTIWSDTDIKLSNLGSGCPFLFRKLPLRWGVFRNIQNTRVGGPSSSSIVLERPRVQKWALVLMFNIMKGKEGLIWGVSGANRPRHKKTIHIIIPSWIYYWVGQKKVPIFILFDCKAAILYGSTWKTELGVHIIIRWDHLNYISFHSFVYESCYIKEMFRGGPWVSAPSPSPLFLSLPYGLENWPVGAMSTGSCPRGSCWTHWQEMGREWGDSIYSHFLFCQVTRLCPPTIGHIFYNLSAMSLNPSGWV